MLYALLYFTMFLVILLDRRDPLAGTAGTASGGLGDAVVAASGLLDVVGGTGTSN